MSENTYTVKTEIFEGPLDLLLSLIEKRKLFINDISLAKVADDYIRYLNDTEAFPIGQSADFILVASTLILIKSKSLLPTIELSEEEEEDIKSLEDRLKIYQKMKDLSVHVKERFGKQLIFPRQGNSAIVPVFHPDEEMTVGNIKNALEEVIGRLPKQEKMLEKKVQKVISLEEMIDRVTDRIKTSLRTNFKSLTGNKNPKNKEERVEIVVGFLAILELFKQGIVNIQQRAQFEDIEIESRNVNTPHY